MTTVATLWEGDNYTGRSAVITQPAEYLTATAAGILEKSLSSLQIAAFYQIVIYDGPRLTGNKYTVLGPRKIPTLTPAGWQDKAVSFAITRVEPEDAFKLNCCRGITSGEQCGEYVQGSATCDDATRFVCTSEANLSSPYCQSWCRNNPAVCDVAVANYCKTRAGDPFCSCLLSPAGKIANPKCVDRNCVNTGYLTTNMQQTSCPAQITCETNAYLANSGVLLTSIPVAQNCGQQPAPAQKDSSTLTEKNTGLGFSFSLFVFLVLIAAVIFFGAAVMGFFDRIQNNT